MACESQAIRALSRHRLRLSAPQDPKGSDAHVDAQCRFRIRFSVPEKPNAQAALRCGWNRTARSYPGGNAVSASQARHLRHRRSWLRRCAHRPPPRPQGYALRSRRCDAVSIRFCRRRSVKSETPPLTCVPPNPYRTGCSKQKQPTQRPRKDPLRVFLRPISGS